MNLKKIFFYLYCLSVMFVACVIANNKSGGEQNIYDYEITTPKPGFIGGPHTAAARTPMMPKDQSDFCTRHIRVTKIVERELPDMRRIVFRIDEIDDKGNITIRSRTSMEGVYFIYIDISSEGTAILKKNEDDNSNGEDFGGTKFSLPFPFNCVRSPTLGFKNGEMDGYVQSAGHGIEFVRKKAKESDKSVQVEAAYFDTREAGKTRWLGNDIDRIRKSEKTRVLFREQQEWANENDLLWTRMERYDGNGNFMMRCRKITIGSIAKEDDWPINFRMTNVNDWFTSQGSTNSMMK